MGKQRESKALTLETHTQPFSIRQIGLQPSFAFRFPSSHCSEDTSTSPFPQSGSDKHREGESTQAYPTSMSQFDEQPSPLAKLPSSQSSNDSSTPLPHVGDCANATCTQQNRSKRVDVMIRLTEVPERIGFRPPC